MYLILLIYLVQRSIVVNIIQVTVKVIVFCLNSKFGRKDPLLIDKSKTVIRKRM